jgi:predicted nucleic acid-binding protein
MELMSVHGLGRKRILDTVLAATLETAHVRRLATLNARDFALFDFIEVVDPCDVHHHA